MAAALHGGIDHIRLVPGERCLVCLCDYEVGEEIRRLAKCKHLFHRECIDQVRQRISLSLSLVGSKKYDSFTDLRL